jgi:multisubunit Na+/H+ antiporter MnhB subunit
LNLNRHHQILLPFVTVFLVEYFIIIVVGVVVVIIITIIIITMAKTCNYSPSWKKMETSV